MRTLKRNQRPVWYCLYKGETEQVDGDGNYSGEKVLTYDAPVKLMANVSPATGRSNTDMFGNLTDYDRVIVSDDTTLAIDENTVLFVDTAPTDGKGEAGYDYIVRRVAKSINSISIAIQHVNVTPVEDDTPDTPSTDDTQPENGGDGEDDTQPGSG